MVTTRVATLTSTTLIQRLPSPVSVDDWRNVPMATPVIAWPTWKEPRGNQKRPGASSANASPTSIATKR
jgi:hypothetical protein